MILINAIISLTKYRIDIGVAALDSVSQNWLVGEKTRLKNTFPFILIFAFIAFIAPLQLHRAFGYKLSKLAITCERNEILGYNFHYQVWTLV